MIALSLTPTETLRVFSPYEPDQDMPKDYEHGTDLKCPQDVDGVTWFKIRTLTQSERRAATAMAPDMPEGEHSDRATTAWILELQKCYLAFGLVAVEHDEWKAEKTARFLGQRHWPIEELDKLPTNTQVWLANAVYQLSHPK